MPATSRRAFLKTAALASAPFLLRWDLRAAEPAARKTLRFGLCSDPHFDVVHDGEARLRDFLTTMKKEQADFILQLGDFCVPKPQNRKYIELWNTFSGPRYHTLGNHDRDGGFKWEQVMKFWGMPAPYYSFDKAGWHFVVLDGNEPAPKKIPGYPRHIGEKQRAWLAADLAATKLPTLVFCHQSLEAEDNSIENRAQVRAILEKANADAGWTKVGVCFSGHHHIDHKRTINGVTYVQINSMSFSYLGDKYARTVFSPEIEKNHPFLRYTAPYRDPLFATVTLSANGEIRIAGRTSAFIGPSPWERGVPNKPGTSVSRERLVPKISDAVWTLKTGV